MLLTDAERQKFADYLERDAQSSEGLADQMDKINQPIMTMLAKKHRAEALAARVVARRLRMTESMTVEAPRPAPLKPGHISGCATEINQPCNCGHQTPKAE